MYCTPHITRIHTFGSSKAVCLLRNGMMRTSREVACHQQLTTHLLVRGNTPKEGDKSLPSVFLERRGGIVDPCGLHCGTGWGAFLKPSYRIFFGCLAESGGERGSVMSRCDCCGGTSTPRPLRGLGTTVVLRAQFDCNLTAIWFKFDVGGEETEAPEVPRLQ
jgi:hypothetical protein